MSLSSSLRKPIGVSLSEEVVATLSTIAASQGKSLNELIETVLVSFSSNPSPSGDKWFTDPENMASIWRGIADSKNGRTREYTIDEISASLGL